ncbi:MAG: GNAT family N-acetyltransferase [Candidatus Lokiarchaeota archaeon]|nr:GNAT family N-acetyltransferase [Candidatus Lokiarchaeota archaeon]
MSIKLAEPLETRRLYIRQFTQEDYEGLVSKLNDAFPEEDYPLFSYFKERDVECFLLQLREISHVIGYIFLRAFEKDKKLECYYALFSQYTGNGYAIEALKIVFEYLFKNHNIASILAYVEPGNTRGWKVAERAGMKYMGDIFHVGKNSKLMYFLINKRDYINQFQF